MSLRYPTPAPEHRTARRNAPVPQVSKPTYYGAETRQPSSVVSSAPGGRPSNDDHFRMATTQRRISSLPRPTNTQSGPRLNEIASSRPAPALAYPSKPKTSKIDQRPTTTPDPDILLFYPVDDSPSQTMAPMSGVRYLDSDAQSVVR